MACVVTSESETGEDGVGDTTKQSIELIKSLSKLESAIQNRLNALLGVSAHSDSPENVVHNQWATQSSKLPNVCLSRLMLGACCEAYLSYTCSLIVKPGYSVRETRETTAVAVMYRDACLVATWTSAHAVYMHDLVSHNSLAPSPPSIHSVPNQFTEFDLSDLYARRTSPTVLQTRDGAQLLSLMTRCTNPGSRGWDSAVKQSLDSSDGTRRVCTNALVVSMTGMNSCIHPAIRLHWTKRLRLVNSLIMRLPANDILAFAQKCIVEFKEITRRMVSNCTSSAYATAAALRHVEHPVALFEPCPLGVPCSGLETSCMAFALAGKAFVETGCKGDISRCVLDAFHAQSIPVECAEAEQYLLWNPSYLGTRTPTHHTTSIRATLTGVFVVSQAKEPPR